MQVGHQFLKATLVLLDPLDLPSSRVTWLPSCIASCITSCIASIFSITRDPQL